MTKYSIVVRKKFYLIPTQKHTSKKIVNQSILDIKGKVNNVVTQHTKKAVPSENDEVDDWVRPSEPDTFKEWVWLKFDYFMTLISLYMEPSQSVELTVWEWKRGKNTFCFTEPIKLALLFASLLFGVYLAMLYMGRGKPLTQEGWDFLYYLAWYLFSVWAAWILKEVGKRLTDSAYNERAKRYWRSFRTIHYYWFKILKKYIAFKCTDYKKKAFSKAFWKQYFKDFIKEIFE